MFMTSACYAIKFKAKRLLVSWLGGCCSTAAEQQHLLGHQEVRLVAAFGGSQLGVVDLNLLILCGCTPGGVSRRRGSHSGDLISDCCHVV